MPIWVRISVPKIGTVTIGDPDPDWNLTPFNGNSLESVSGQLWGPGGFGYMILCGSVTP